MNREGDFTGRRFKNEKIFLEILLLLDVWTPKKEFTTKSNFREDASGLVGTRVEQVRGTALGSIGAETFPSGQILSGVVEDRLLYDGVLPGQWQATRLLLWAGSQLVGIDEVMLPLRKQAGRHD